MSTATKNRKSEAVRPVQEIRFGRVKAAIWANETDKGVRHNVTFQRIYLNAEGKWQSTDSFGRDDLPLVAKVADLAHSWIFQNASVETNSRDEGNGEVQF